MNKKLDTRVTRCCGVIDGDIENHVSIDEIIESFCRFGRNNDFVSEYYIIKHDDADTLHCHFILICSKQLRLSTFLNKLSSSLSINVKCISIDTLRDINAYLRYMLHIGEDKKQYSISDIHSNMDDLYISDYINKDSDNSTLTTEQLFRMILLNQGNELKLMVALGLNKFHKYRHEIGVCLDHYMTLLDKYSYLANESNDLPF